MNDKIYDVVIIGGGPGGYSAALYCARSGMSVLVLEKLSPGGQMATTGQVDNYPGFEDGIDGFELGEKMKKGADRFGAETAFDEVIRVDLKAEPKKIATTGGELLTKTVVIATGASPRELGLPEEKKLRGRGVAYCAVCDGMRYKDKTVVVSGGGNSAAEDALFLAKICKKVYLVHRRDALRASMVYQNALKDSPVEFLWNSRIEEILHEKKVTGVRLADVKTGEERERNEQGYIIADETTRTNVPGVFAVGDVRTKPLRQIVTAASDGAVASKFIEEFIQK